MPAILRIFLPNNYALIVIIRPYAFYDVVGVRRAGPATAWALAAASGSGTL
jgi:hypothetical protein